MAVCAAYGISRSHFLGGPRRWTDDDRECALWWEIQSRQRCGSCGTRTAEWDPALGGHDSAYKPEVHRCYGCAARAKAEARIPDDDKGAGVHVILTRSPAAWPPPP